MTLFGSLCQKVRGVLRPFAFGLLTTIALWLALPGVASAHAHLVQADPTPGAVIAHSPAVASFVFDEALNATLTRVRITDATGHPVTGRSGYLVAGHSGEMWRLSLPSLPAGTYSVFWTSESATDGHVMSSFYTFRVAPRGASAGLGAITGAMAGMSSGSMSRVGLSIDWNVLAITFFGWLGLMAQAMWLGALIVELAVLAPARRARETSEARLAWVATPQLWRLVRMMPPVIIGALVGNIVSLALAGTGGDWALALAPATLGGILSSQNGSLIVARLVMLLVAVQLTVRVTAPSNSNSGAHIPPRSRPRMRRAPQALGIAAPLFVPLQLDWESMRVPMTILAAGYMLVAAFSGHAANVAPAYLWQSCIIDWLHLLCTAAWAGGMAALAYGVMPARRLVAPLERARAILPLLDRFSPVAYIAVGVLALSGLYSAAHHLDTPSMLSSTFYGQLLVLKLGLVGLLIILSGSHVMWLRPRIGRAQYRATLTGHMGDGSRDMATVHEGLSTLASRLRLEAWIGAAILLATALMAQTLPANAAPASAAHAPRSPLGAITGAAMIGDLHGQLSIAPPTVGAATFSLRLWEHGTPITADTGAAIIHLYPAAQPAMRASLTPQASGARFTFTVRGSLAATGIWRADVLVRTVTVTDYRTLSFTFAVGSAARFLPPPGGVSPDAHAPRRQTGVHSGQMSGM